MFCVQCGKPLAECTCPDIDQRMRQVRDSPYLSFKWCRTCDKHYARCKCEAPDFYITGHGAIPPRDN